MRRYLIFFIVLLIPSTTFASSLTGDYNEFDVTGLSSGDYWEAWIFDGQDDSAISLADTTCGQYGSGGAKSVFSAEDVGFGGDTLEPGDYTMLIGAGGGCGGNWDHNPTCGAGNTIAECEATFGSFPLTATYGVTIEFTVEAEQSSSTPSSTNATTTMTEFEMQLSYYMLLILVFIVAGAVYSLVRPR